MTKPFQSTEYEEQCAVFAWARLREKTCWELRLLHANLNGLKLPVGLAVKAKKMGMPIGVPDMVLPVPMGQYHGLYVELKRADGGHLSEFQKWWLSELEGLGYRAIVCAGASEAIVAISNYLRIKI